MIVTASSIACTIRCDISEIKRQTVYGAGCERQDTMIRNISTEAIMLGDIWELRCV